MAIEYLKKGLDEKQRIEDNDKVKKLLRKHLEKLNQMVISILENYHKNLITIHQIALG